MSMMPLTYIRPPPWWGACHLHPIRNVSSAVLGCSLFRLCWYRVPTNLHCQPVEVWRLWQCLSFVLWFGCHWSCVSAQVTLLTRAEPRNKHSEREYLESTSFAPVTLTYLMIYMIHARGLPMLLHFYRCSDWHSSMNSSLLSVIYRTRLHYYAMREQSSLACTLICCNGWSRGLRHTFFDWQFMRVACTGFPVTPWADSCWSSVLLPWISVLRLWRLKNLSSFPFVNEEHQRKGNESPRDATGTRNHPSFVRHKHLLSFWELCSGIVIDNPYSIGTRVLGLKL